jgi:outer membrane protein OmpA-like peptidoglycan-associated protein/tetratricopeptide (TPR) repeat protein
MRYYLQSLIVLFLLSSSAIEAQTDVTVRRKDFKVDKSGFDEAWKHVLAGDDYFDQKGIWYSNAFDEYIKAVVYNNSNPELNYKTGVSALFSDKKEEAAGFLLKALELKSDVAADVLLLTGRSLQYTGRYSEAIEKYQGYLNSPVKKSAENVSLAIKCMEECNSALIITADTLRIGITNIGPNINSSSDDYSELFSTDGKTLYFASRREQPKSGDRYSDTKFDENIFVSRQINSSWELAVTAGKDITTRFCETPLYINSTNDILYIYAGYVNGGDIMMSVNKKGVWKTPEPVPFGINSNGSETAFTFTPSGNEIYYVTDNGKDNIGGKDIYFIKKINERKWSKPQNAGSVINSAYDEESVRFSKTGDTLWFSSRGHNSIGGFDIFYSVKNQAGEWDSVKNYGYPVNTPWDEVFYNPSSVDDSAFYFVSNRSGGFGGLDIYQGRILPPEPVAVIVPPAPPKVDTVIIRDTVVVVKEVVPVPPPVTVVQPEPVKELVLYLIGSVKDSETGEPVMAKIDVIDLSTDQVVVTTASSDVDGSYRVRLPARIPYMIDLRATGFLSDMKRINIPETYSQDFYKLDIALIKVKVGKKVVMNNILFETGKSILTVSSYTELDRLLNIMQDNSQMKIEISGHTDKTGSEPINFKLSEARAKAVVEYLVQKGIDRARMEYKGFGSLQPIADNATSQGRAKNRRVEFKILEF